MRLSRRFAAVSVCWGLACFVAAQLTLSVLLEGGRPEWRDPEYGRKLQSLRQHTAAEPGRRLFLALGSSRVTMGLRPGILEGEEAGGASRPLVFNFSLLGSGPVMELVCLRRLLADGVRPDRVFVEFWPPLCNQEGPHAEERHLDTNRFGLRDVGVLEDYWSDAGELRHRWQRSRLVPAFEHRFVLLSQWAPNWLPWQARLDSNWGELDGWGWRPWPDLGRETGGERVARARKELESRLIGWRFSPRSERAMRELAGLCQDEQIPLALLVMPEGRAMQSWYPPGVWEEARGHLYRLAGELNVPVIDARDWSAEGDFADGFHLVPAGATAFTRRFEREVVQPLARGQTLQDPAKESR